MDVNLAAADDHRKPRGSVDVMYISLQDEVPNSEKSTLYYAGTKKQS